MAKDNRKSGRPDKLTPECAALIIEALQKHNYVSTACDLAGISDTTFYNWLDRAEKYQTRLIAEESIEEEGRRYIAFLENIKQARARSEGELLGRIDKAGSVATLIEKRTIEHTLKDGSNKTETIERWKPPDWTADAWILERTRWEKYGQHSSLDIQQAGVIFIERLQRARGARVVDGEFREIEDIAKEPTAIEEPGQVLITASVASRRSPDQLGTAPKRRPIFELIAKKRESKRYNTDYTQSPVSDKYQSTTPESVPTSQNNTLSEPDTTDPKGSGLHDQAQPVEEEVIEETVDERSAAQKSEGGER